MLFVLVVRLLPDPVADADPVFWFRIWYRECWWGSMDVKPVSDTDPGLLFPVAISSPVALPFRKLLEFDDVLKLKV